MKFFKNRIVAIALTALTVAGCLGYGWYSRPVPVPKATFGDWSYDGAHILSEETEQLIDGYNARWDEEYDGVTALATVPTARNWEIYDFATTMGQKWGLGPKDSLLLIDKAGDRYYLVTSGYIDDSVGYEKLYGIVYDEFVPAYNNGSYDAAVAQFYGALDEAYESGTSASAAAQQGEAHEYYSPYYDNSVSPAKESAGTLGRIIVFGALAWLVFSLIDRARYRKWYRTRGTPGFSPAAFNPLLGWHKPGSAWFRRMTNASNRAAYTPPPRNTSGYRPNGTPPQGRRVSNYQRGGYGGTTMRPGSFTSGGTGSARPGGKTSAGSARSKSPFDV